MREKGGSFMNNPNFLVTVIRRVMQRALSTDQFSIHLTYSLSIPSSPSIKQSIMTKSARASRENDARITVISESA